MGIAQYNRGSRALSAQIDREMLGSNARVAVEHPPAEPEKPKVKPVTGYWTLPDDPTLVKVGDRVYCTVSACRGWMTVTDIKGNRRDIRIKTDAFGRSWGYGHNFTFEPPDWMVKR